MDELQDIELESEAQGGMGGGASQVVRKTISLNLTKKTKLKAKSSAKSGKSKKERRVERDIDDNNDLKTSRRSKVIEKKRDVTTDSDDREDEELDWTHKVIFCGEKMQNPMIHVCEKCSLPILIYGRLSPCKHVFCLSCAEKSNGSCTRCKERIDRIEPAGIGQIFVCSFGGSSHGVSECRRSYLSQRDLIAHIKHRHEKEGSTIPESELLSQQGVVRMPFINGGPNMVVQPPMSISNASQSNGLSNPVMIPAMPPPSQPIFVDANRMPMIPSQPFQPMQQSIPLGQSQYQTSAYIPQSQGQYQGMPPQPQPPPTQPQVPRPDDMQVRTSVALPAVQAPPPPPPPPQGEWRGGNQIPPNAQDWASQGRTGNYQAQQYYK